MSLVSMSTILFYVSAISIIGLAAVGIASVWKLVDSDIAGRAAATIAIVGGSSAAISFIGYMLNVKW